MCVCVCVCVCVLGGGGYPPPHGRGEIFFFDYVYPDGLFGTIKELLDCPINGGPGPLCPFSYVSESGVARICQAGGGGGNLKEQIDQVGGGQSEGAK